jgi:hypothetical protein
MIVMLPPCSLALAILPLLQRFQHHRLRVAEERPRLPVFGQRSGLVRVEVQTQTTERGGHGSSSGPGLELEGRECPASRIEVRPLQGKQPRGGGWRLAGEHGHRRRHNINRRLGTTGPGQLGLT